MTPEEIERKKDEAEHSLVKRQEKPDLAYEPWVEDPDPPEDDMTDEQLKQFAEGAARLLEKP